MILVGIDVAKDKVNAKTIALMLATESNDNAYSLQAYTNEEVNHSRSKRRELPESTRLR